MARFMFFSRASLEFLVVTGRQPDVLHLHDWQSSTVVRATPPVAATRGFLFACSTQELWAGLQEIVTMPGPVSSRVAASAVQE